MTSPLPPPQAQPQTVRVRLTSMPVRGAVGVDLGRAPGSEGAGQVTVAYPPGSPSQARFTPSNWDTWQNITVLAVDDPDKEGVHRASLCLGVESEDPGYAAWAGGAGAGACVPVEIQDNELATPATKVLGGGGNGNGGGGGAPEEVKLTSGA